MAASQDAKDIELLVSDVFLRHKTLKPFDRPPICKQQVDHGLMIFVAEFGLVYIPVNSHPLNIERFGCYKNLSKEIDPG